MKLKIQLMDWKVIMWLLSKIKQETRLYNGDTDTARSMRSKEEANDYRYFPCPDLLPVVLETAYIEQLRKSLPELPDARQARFVQQYQLSDYDAGVLSGDANMAHYFEKVVAECKDSKLVANWCMGELSARLNAEDKNIKDCPITPDSLATLITRIKDGTISGKMAKDIFEALWDKKGSVDDIIKQQGGGQISDLGALEAIVDQVIAASPQQTDNYRKATEDKRPKMLGYFVGQIMKLSQGKANPQQVNDLLLKKLNG